MGHLVDDLGRLFFVDDTGRMSFVDDLGNVTYGAVLHDRVLDSGLNVLADEADNIYICHGEPPTYAAPIGLSPAHALGLKDVGAPGRAAASAADARRFACLFRTAFRLWRHPRNGSLTITRGDSN